MTTKTTRPTRAARPLTKAKQASVRDSMLASLPAPNAGPRSKPKRAPFESEKRILAVRGQGVAIVRLPPRTLSCEHAFDEVCRNCVPDDTQRCQLAAALAEPRITRTVLRVDAHRLFSNDATMTSLSEAIGKHGDGKCTGCPQCVYSPSVPPLRRTLELIAIVLECPRDRLGRLDLAWGNAESAEACVAREELRKYAVSLGLGGARDELGQLAMVARAVLSGGKHAQ